jgi:hypothetical protein
MDRGAVRTQRAKSSVLKSLPHGIVQPAAWRSVHYGQDMHSPVIPRSSRARPVRGPAAGRRTAELGRAHQAQRETRPWRLKPMIRPTPAGRLLSNVLAMVAEFQSDLIRLRTRTWPNLELVRGDAPDNPAQGCPLCPWTTDQ